MKTKASKYLEIVIESINYIIISYALSNMAILFQSNPLFILFFASEIWVIGNYWRKVCDMVKNLFRNSHWHSVFYWPRCRNCCSV